MSGHSKWSTIKHKKAATDKKRAAVFAKLAKAITIAANESGGDPETNYTLRNEIEKAKSLNLPKDKIEQAIKRGTGELKEGARLEELLMEVLGPSGTMLLIEIITDNRNRATSEIRHILSQNNGKLAGEGSVKWQFTRYGVLRVLKNNIQDKESFELAAIEADAQDLIEEKECFIVYTSIDNMQKMLHHLTSLGYNKINSYLEWIPNNTLQLDKKSIAKVEKLFEALDEHDDVQEIYTNIDYGNEELKPLLS